MVVVVPSPDERVDVTESLIRDLNKDSMWCEMSGMKLNASKTKTIIAFRSPPVNHIDSVNSIHPQSTTLILGLTVQKKSVDFVIFGDV